MAHLPYFYWYIQELYTNLLCILTKKGVKR